MGILLNDFLDFVEQNPDSAIFEYDSVIGKLTNHQAILTITHKDNNFQFGFVVQKGNSRPVIEKINLLKSLFGDQFYEIFQINLADNGSEFELFVEIETDSKNKKRCGAFYTRP